jgi:FkbM family methyltransferase
MDEAWEAYPLLVGLPCCYRSLMRLTHRRGQSALSRIHARLYPGGERIRHSNGAQMVVPGNPHFFGYLVDHESHVARVIRDVVRPGDTCVDVGANIGYFSTMLAGACGTKGRVICYEPEARNFAVLEENSKLAAKSGLNLVAVRAAVSETPGTVTMDVGGESTRHHIVVQGEAASSSQTVGAVNLAEDVVARGVTGPVRFMKMDVEGHEIPVLRGARSWLAKRTVGTLIVEVEPGEAADAVEKMVRDWNARAICWYDDAWHETPVSKIRWRGDIRIDFN